MAIISTGTFVADGQSNVFTVNLSGRSSGIETITISAQGDFGGGSLALQMTLDGGTTWSNIPDPNSLNPLSADGEFNYRAAPYPTGGGNKKYRLNLSGSTTPDVTYMVTDGS